MTDEYAYTLLKANIKKSNFGQLKSSCSCKLRRALHAQIRCSSCLVARNMTYKYASQMWNIFSSYNSLSCIPMFEVIHK